ncbi:MAG: hypothetical protein U0570_04150 [Phycisphaerales bacterium]
MSRVPDPQAEPSDRLARGSRAVTRSVRTVGRAARGRHGSLAMVGVWAIGVVFFSGLIMYLLAMRTPSWFRDGLRDDEAARQLAQRLENRLITEAYRFRGAVKQDESGVRLTGEPWKIRITEEEATAWLTVKLHAWLANMDPPARLPPEVCDVQAHFSPGRASIGARLEGSVVAVSARAEIETSGVWIRGGRGGVGSLMLPLSWGGWALAGGEELQQSGAVWKILAGRAPLLNGATIRTEDGRQVRVLAIEPAAGVLDVVCRTEVP